MELDAGVEAKDARIAELEADAQVKDAPIVELDLLPARETEQTARLQARVHDLVRKGFDSKTEKRPPKPRAKPQKKPVSPPWSRAPGVPACRPARGRDRAEAEARAAAGCADS